MSNYKHGHTTAASIRQGGTATFRAWRKMWQKDRPFEVDSSWTVFANFLANMGEKPEGTVLTRCYHDKPMGPLNAFWAPHSVALKLAAFYRRRKESEERESRVQMEVHEESANTATEVWWPPP